MNKYYLLVTWVAIFGFFSTTVLAQDQRIEEGKNLVKLNALTLIGGKISLEYERLLTKKIAVGAAVSMRPNAGLPFKNQIESYIDDEEINELLGGFESGNFSFTPEVRFYLSSRGAFRGFYIAPYAKFASYDATVPYKFDVEEEFQGQPVYSRTETIPLSGSIRSITGGISFGFNFRLADNWFLDWRLIGPGYGSAKGDVSGAMALIPDEQAALREALGMLQDDLEDLPLAMKIAYEVDANGAKVDVLKSPWASIRSGLSIAYRF